ncbi:unnamed protein product [Urochloa humidicola]
MAPPKKSENAPSKCKGSDLDSGRQKAKKSDDQKSIKAIGESAATEGHLDGLVKRGLLGAKSVAKWEVPWAEEVYPSELDGTITGDDVCCYASTHMLASG